MKKLLSLAATCALLGSAVTANGAGMPDGDATAGQQKAQTCAACHGPDGNSTNSEWPKLAGQNADYLYKQLMDFKSGERANAVMAGMAAPLSEQDMADLAAYFSGQIVARSSADPDLVALGEAVFKGGNLNTGVPACMACHGINGAGNPGAAFPALAAQHAQYTETQLNAFRTLARANDPGQMMRNIAQKMTDQEMKAVSSFVEGLQ